MNRTQLKAAIEFALSSDINVTLPATDTHGSHTIGNGQILLESFVSENGARNIIIVDIEQFIDTLDLETLLAAKAQLRYQDLVDSDIGDIKGYRKYFDRWKAQGKIS